MDSNSEIILAATLAGIVAIAVTVAIEKFGGILGGIFGTVPTTIIPAAAFMWLADSNQSAYGSNYSKITNLNGYVYFII